jgi:hypothetical protein
MMRYQPCELYNPVRNARQTVPLYRESLPDLLGEPLQKLLAMRAIVHWPYQVSVEFVFPAVEELLMTLDGYYFGCPTSILDFLLPGGKSPILQRVRQSIAYIPQLLGF